jgi:outer membrane protein assembly factor BamB
MLKEGFDPAYGEMASPILADGVLLVSWSQPTGETKTDLSKIKHRYYDNAEVNEKLRDTYFRIDADWKTVALDAASGKILWERTEPSASLNFLSNKRNHNGISGAAGDGVYVTVTMLGHVYAYDLKTGKTRWSLTLEEWNELAQAVKEESLAQKRITSLKAGPFGHKRSGVLFVDGLMILPDLRGGLLAVKASDGSRVWQTDERLHDQATPRLWKQGGRNWIVASYAAKRERAIHLLDPANGETKWSHETGANPGQLLMGEGYVLLNKSPRTGKTDYLSCYQITLDGLEELWSFEETKADALALEADFGAHRKGVIRDGILYIKLGAGKGKRARMAAVDLKTGEELDAVSDPRLGANAGQPFIAEDKLYLQQNSAHSGGKAGLYIYEIGADKGVSYVGSILFKGLGVSMMTAYQYPIEYPYKDGLLYVRGKRQIAAVDLSVVDVPMAKVNFHGLWAGFQSPVNGVLFADRSGTLQAGRVETPPRKELGVVGTSAYRSDFWAPIEPPKSAKIGDAFEATFEIEMGTFSWDAEITMEEARGDIWMGSWSRTFTGWPDPVSFEGELHSSSEGGFDQRGWPTGWLKDRPVTFFSDLPEGQERVFLQLHGFIPLEKGRRNMTLCLDHDGQKVLGGVGGGFSFNQAYHEVDPSGLEVTSDGIRGTAVVIINSDGWVSPDYRNGESLAGRVTLDVRFGEPNSKGIYPLEGDWSVEWGLPLVQTGLVEARLLDESGASR